MLIQSSSPTGGIMCSPGDALLELVRFCPCTEEDLPEIVRGALKLLEEFQETSPLDLSILRNALIEQTRRELPEYTKLLQGDQLLGWFRLVRHSASLELDDVNILEGFRSQGLGSLLIGRVREIAAKEDLPVRCTVSSDNSGALRFYQRHGFLAAPAREKRIELYLPNNK